MKTATTMQNSKYEELLFWILGAVSGGIAFVYRPTLDFLFVGWAKFFEGAWSILWAGGIAFVTGAAGAAGKRWWDKRGSKFFAAMYKRYFKS